MINLSATNRCKLFEEIANSIWTHIIHNQRVSVNVSEIGITMDIIASIRTHSTSIPNFGVWANPGYNENVFGSDIDVFVETKMGQYIWYALQAKVLAKSGRYRDIKTKRAGEYQWKKLDRLSAVSGCISKYLFYNGVSNYHHFGFDTCNRSFDEKQFGCSIVDTNTVENICLSKSGNPKFLDFHPVVAQPWRVIVCCMNNLKKVTLFSSAQVKSALSDYYPLYEDTTFLVQASEGVQPINDFPVEAITTFSELAKWTPVYRVIIRTTKGRNLDKRAVKK